MPIYNSITTSGRLWQCYRDETHLDNNCRIGDFTGTNLYNKSLKYN